MDEPLDVWCHQCLREHEPPATFEGQCWFAVRHRFLDFKPGTARRQPHFLKGLANVFYDGDVQRAEFVSVRARHLARMRREADQTTCEPTQP